MNLNNKYKLGLKEKFTERDVIFRLKIDYTQQIEVYHFIGYADVIAKLGGMRAALVPAFSFLVPLAILYFLWTLVRIIKQSYQA